MLLQSPLLGLCFSYRPRLSRCIQLIGMQGRGAPASSVPALETSVFLVPGGLVTSGEDRLVVLNRVAESVIESVRGKHAGNVFGFRGKPVTRMLNTAWMRARQSAGLAGVRVHDLAHTVGRRLRAAGVSFEDCQDLLGHRPGRITTHY